MTDERYSLWICQEHGTFKTKALKAKCPKCNSVKVKHLGYYNPTYDLNNGVIQK